MTGPFRAIYDGPLTGILTWDTFDALWQTLARSGGEWYVADMVLTPIPARPSPDFERELQSAATLLAPARKQSYCGAVYVDDSATPGFVKVFDPAKMGSACGGSGDLILPRYIFSRIKPEPIMATAPEKPASFLSRLLRR